MTQLLVFRERLKTFYQKYALYIQPVIKFIVSFIIFTLFNNELGYDERLTKLPVVLALSLICAFTPSTIVLLLAAVFAIGHIYKLSQFLAIICVIIILIIYILFARFTPKQGYVILGIPLLYMLNIPYTIPILLGLIATPLSIIPVSCGVIIYYFIDIITQVARTMTVTTSVDDILVLYSTVINNLVSNRFMLLSIAVFAVVLVVTYFVRNLQIDHSFESSIIAGGVVNVLFFLIGDLVIDSSDLIFKMIIGTIISCVIVYIIQFFRLTLEYSRVERVQFEDDQYYYYVKAVPKMIVTTPEVSVKHFNTTESKEDEDIPEIDEFEEEFDLRDTISDLFKEEDTKKVDEQKEDENEEE